MPITCHQIAAGDVLFKHASSGIISQAIRFGQRPHYKKTVKKVGMHSPVGMKGATNVTHVAIAAAPNDVLEFDEGGASMSQIVRESGHGFVRGGMGLTSRRGNRYDVFSCNNKDLAAAAADKADLMWDLTHQGSAQASYGVKKVLQTSLFHTKGSRWTKERFRGQLNDWLEQAYQHAATPGPTKLNIQFFCSEFAMFCYLWAASELEDGRFENLSKLLGTNYSRISPVELYTRMDTYGAANFRFKGSLYTAGSAAA